MSRTVTYDNCGNVLQTVHHGASESFVEGIDWATGRPYEPRAARTPELAPQAIPAPPAPTVPAGAIELLYHAESDCYLYDVYSEKLASALVEPVQYFSDYAGHLAEAERRGVFPPPPAPAPLAGTLIPLPYGHSEVMATLDFETTSVAGYVWGEEAGKWKALAGARDKGLPAVGSRVYAQHPTAEVVTMSYDLKDGHGVTRWKPGDPVPARLFAHVAAGRPIEAHNAMFERTVWAEICVPKYGFPSVAPWQWHCSAAKARAHGLPGALDNLGDVLELGVKKDADGKRLMKMFSMPRDPTKKDPRRWILRAEEPEEAERYDLYCDRDVDAESAVSAVVPDLIPSERAYWRADQEINWRGVGVDLPAVRSCIAVVNDVLSQYGAQMRALTGGLETTQVAALKGWLAAKGVPTKSLDAEHLEGLLSLEGLAPDVRRVLEIRQLTGSASVKKVFAMLNHATHDGRLCDLFIYHGARTGRDTHADVQPGNLPKAGPSLRWCEEHACKKPYGAHRGDCPWCGASAAFSEPKGWSWQAVDHALQVLATGSAAVVEYFFGDAMLTVSGCIRGMFVAGVGKRLICSDYSSIEAVVTAALSGEQWRMDAFERREDIYLHGAAGITGNTYEFYKAWSAANDGAKHPDRQALGKPGELGLGFGGWISAWRAFGGEGTDDEIKAKIIAWRNRSPMIVEAWGGQFRGAPWSPTSREYYGLEGMALQAVLNPGQRFDFRMVGFEMLGDCLYAILPSGRRIAYHAPRLYWGAPARHPDWPASYSLTFMTWNSNPKMGPLGWGRMDTYGGRLFENLVQGIARDIMAFAVVNLEAAGYPIVLRVHDELAAEVAHDFGSVEEFERIMATLPPWAAGWPIRAAGGWAGERYRKD